jgi:O-Antigen ligase
MIVSVLAAAYLATSVVDWPVLPFGARLPDVVFVGLTAAMLSGRPLPLRQFHRLDLLVLLYIAGGLPSLLASSNVLASAIELGRHGYLALTYAIVAMVVARGRAVLVGSSLAAGVLALAAIGVIGAAVYTLVPFAAPLVGETMVVPYFGEVFRVRALAASPTMLACALTVAMPLALSFALHCDDRRSRVWWLAAGTAGAVAAILTVSHAVAALVLALFIAAWPLLSRWARLRPMVGVAVLGGILLANVTLVATFRSVETHAAVVAAESPKYHHVVGAGEWRIGELRVAYELMGYFRLKQIALETFAEHPWTGVGLDRFHELTEQAFVDRRLPSIYRAIDPHSSLLGRLAEAGVFGGLTLVALWVAAVSVGRSLSRSGSLPWLAQAATASLIGLIVASINVDIMNFRAFWALLGLLRGLTEERIG